METTYRKPYEITFYTKEENAEPVKTAIIAHGGEILEERPFEKVRFEYRIKKELFAFLGIVRAVVPPEKVGELSRALSLDSRVLRFLITATSVPPAGSGEAAKTPERKRPAPPRRAMPEPTVLTNEDIERKIEEILQ